jgi:putative toxin-antitoxin system antitoxin component (TIGR02293 family)
MANNKRRVGAAAKARRTTGVRETLKTPLSRWREPRRGDTGSDAWWRTLLRRSHAIGSLHGIAPIERIELVRNGVPAAAMGIIAADMGIAKDKLYTMLGLPRATIERKVRQQQRLNADEGERVIGIARLIGQVDQIVHESGNPEGFDSARWVATWLDRPLPALAGNRPATLMDTAEGRDLVARVIAQVQSGAYA